MLKHYFSGVLVALMLILGTSASAADPTPEELAAARDEIRARSTSILTKLYKASPGAKSTIEHAAGYATFSNFGMKILLAGGGKGKGMVINNHGGAETFMKMVELQAGLGFGVKKFSLVFVFETAEAMHGFIEKGWEFGAQTTLAAQTENKGGALQGAVSVSNGIWVYQITNKGLAAEITAKGTKYYKDGDLN